MMELQLFQKTFKGLFHTPKLKELESFGINFLTAYK